MMELFVEKNDNEHLRPNVLCKSVRARHVRLNFANTT